MKIGTQEFDSNRTYVMGILNVTPDSFSDGGKWNRLDRALKHAEQMIREGAAVLDVGGESTRPGYTRISAEEEISRVAPVLERLSRNFDIPLSVDTYKSEVAQAAAAAGAVLINDVWGLKHDPRMAGVIADAGAACCLMHNRRDASYRDFIPEVMADLQESVRMAREAGIDDDKILLDPGVGFAKGYEENLKAVQCLEQFGALGFPILLGASRKSVIGRTLGQPPAGCLAGTLAVTVFAVMQHCQFVRVHDVKENVEAIRMAEAVLGA